MGLLASESGASDVTALLKCADVVATAWNERLHRFGNRFDFTRKYKLLVGMQEVVQCCFEGDRLLQRNFSTPAGAFKRVAAVLVTARINPFFRFVPSPPPGEYTHVLSEAVVLLLPVTLRSLRVKTHPRRKRSAWENLDQWSGFPSAIIDSHFRGLIEWINGTGDLGALILAISLIIQQSYEVGILKGDVRNSGTFPKDSSRAIIPVSRAAVTPDDNVGRQKQNSIYLKSELSKIPTGTKHAGRYHKEVFRLVSAIFEGSLANGVVEQVVNSGRKRIDITFDNMAKDGFFHRLHEQHRIFCPYVFFECKNYTQDLGNPELDQLAGRFHDKRGRFGILTCRRILNWRRSVELCRDVINANQGCVLILEDADITTLVELRNTNAHSDISNFLSQKYRVLLMS